MKIYKTSCIIILCNFKLQIYFIGGFLMTNKQLLVKLQEDMEMRGFSHHTKYTYYHKAQEIIKYFGKPMKQVSTKELRDYQRY